MQSCGYTNIYFTIGITHIFHINESELPLFAIDLILCFFFRSTHPWKWAVQTSTPPLKVSPSKLATLPTKKDTSPRYKLHNNLRLCCFGANQEVWTVSQGCTGSSFASSGDCYWPFAHLRSFQWLQKRFINSNYNNMILRANFN